MICAIPVKPVGSDVLVVWGVSLGLKCYYEDAVTITWK